MCDAKFKNGAAVVIKPEWRAQNEYAGDVYIVHNAEPSATNRVLISRVVDANFPIPPVEAVDQEMIEAYTEAMSSAVNQ